MKTLSLRLPEELFENCRRLAKERMCSRAEYIREAIEKMNRETASELRRKRIADASRRVRKESMRVNAEFAAFERDPDA